MRLSIFTTTFSALVLAAAASCGAQGPDPSSESVGGAESTEDGGSSAPAGGSDPGTEDPEGDGANASNGAGGSEPADEAGGGASEPPPTCSIMSSNVSCKTCLEQHCCEVLHACLDEDLLGCTGCLDCFLSGQGPGCCDQTVGKNDWLAECVAFNCDQEC